MRRSYQVRIFLRPSTSLSNDINIDFPVTLTFSTDDTAVAWVIVVHVFSLTHIVNNFSVSFTMSPQAFTLFLALWYFVILIFEVYIFSTLYCFKICVRFLSDLNINNKKQSSRLATVSSTQPLHHFTSCKLFRNSNVCNLYFCDIKRQDYCMT